MRNLLETRLTKYKKLIKEYAWDEEDDVFDPDFDLEDDDTSDTTSSEDEDDSIQDIANNNFDKVIQDKPKKKLDYDENAPQAGTDTETRTFNKKGNTAATATKDIFSDDNLYDEDDEDTDITSSEDEDDVFIPDWDFDEDVTAAEKKEKKNKSHSIKPVKKSVKIDKNHISLEDELMNDEDGIEYTKPTVSLKMFQKSVDKFKVTGAEFRNPYYNELFSKTVPGTHIDKNGRIYLSISFRTPEDQDNEKFGTGLLIRKNTLAEVFTCLYILLNTVDEYYGSIFIGDYADFFDYYCDYILEEDDDEMELIDEFVRKLREVKITNAYEMKSFIDWYDSKKDEYSARYFDKEPDKKKVRHSKIKDTRQLFREFGVKRDRMKAGRDGRYIDIMGNIVHTLDYDPVKCSDYKPPRKMKSDDLMKLYVAGLILMQKYVPKTEEGMNETPVFQNFAKAALRQGITWSDIVKEYRKY